MRLASAMSITLQQEKVAAAALSRWVTAGSGRDPTPSNRLCRALAFCARVALPVNGTPRPAPAPDLPLGRWPTGHTVLRRLGMTQHELRETFRDLHHYEGARAHLAYEVLERLVPRELWPMAWVMLAEGPGDAARRAERATAEYARTKTPGTRRRTAGQISRTSIQCMHSAVRNLLEIFVELRRLGHEAPELSRWVGVPEIAVPEGGRSKGANATPRLQPVRIALNTLSEIVSDGLGIRPGDDEIAAMRRIPPSIAVRMKIFRALRDRATLVILILTGGRIGAVSALRRSDYVEDHVGVPPDHRGGTALVLRPAKTLNPDEPRVKVIPAEAATMIDAFLFWTDLVYEQAAKCGPYYKKHRRIPERPLDPPLLVSDRTSFSPYGPSGIRLLLSGDPPDRYGTGVKPLVVRESGFNPEMRESAHEWTGYNPHGYRRLAIQLAERAGEEWNAENPSPPGTPAPPPALFGTALADHKPPMDQLRAIYGNRDTRECYELLSARAISIMWQLLSTERGLRRRQNVSAIRERARDLRAVEAELQRKRDAADRISASPRPTLPEEWASANAPDNGVLLKSIHDLHRRVDGAEAVIRALMEIAEGTRRLQEHKDALYIEISDLVHDRRLWELVPDTEPCGADQKLLSMEAALGGEGLLPAELRAEEATEVRDWLTLFEFAWACEIRHRSRVARWAAGTCLPTARAKRPWDRDAVPVDSSLGKHYRRVWAPGVRDSFWPSAAARDRVKSLLSRWPEQQGWAKDGEPGPRCLKPLRLPAPFREQYAATLEEQELRGARTNGRQAGGR
jgi:hypothetical protein